MGRWDTVSPHLCPRSGAVSAFPTRVMEGVAGLVVGGKTHVQNLEGAFSSQCKKPSLFESGLVKESSKQCYHNASSLSLRAVVTRDL